jgi:hypothetical protein
MSIFNFFHKLNSEDVCDLFTKDIVISALRYGNAIETANNQYSVDVGAEIVYFLLHMFDRQLFKEVGPEARKKILDKIAIKVLGDYIIAVLKPETPIEIAEKLGESMLDTFNERQRIYSNCKCLMVKGNPWAKGSTIFALSFFIHKALRKTNRDNVDEILWGERDIVISELDDFPDCRDTTLVCIYASNILIESAKMWKKYIKTIRFS